MSSSRVDPAVAVEPSEFLGVSSSNSPKPVAESSAASATPLPQETKPLPTRSIGISILAGLAIAYTLALARPILFPVMLAIVLALLLRPMVRGLAAHRIPHVLGAAIVLAGAVCVVGIGGYRLATPAAEWVRTLPENLQQAQTKLSSLRDSIEEIREASKKVENLTEAKEAEAVPVTVRQQELPGTLLNITGGLVAGVIVTGMLLYFLLATGDAMLHRAVDLAPAYRDRQNLLSLLQDVERGVSTYLLSFTMINVVLGVLIGSAMWLLGMPNPVLWGVMAGCLNFVPYAGAFVGASVVFLVAVLSFDTVGYALLAPLAYGAINMLEGCIVTPMVLGRSMSLDPIAIVLYLLFWGWIWGIGGALIAVPLLAITRITCDHFESLRSFGNLLGAEHD